MKLILFICLILFIHFSYSAKNPFADYGRTKGRKWFIDEKKVCLNKKVHILKYNVSVEEDNNFLVLEQQGASGITWLNKNIIINSFFVFFK